jgi:hypothetical protein
MVIEGASVSARTMADGTLRLSIDIEPRNAQDAFALFGAPGRAVALAALKDGSAAVKEPEPEKPKGGEWAKLAGMWCTDLDFREWANSLYAQKVHNDVEAAELIRDECGIKSRVELDHDAGALRRFNERIRYPFMKWMQARGITK